MNRPSNLVCEGPPPTNQLAMSKKLPTLEFDRRSFEGSGGFHGIHVCEGGEVTRDERGPYSGHRGG